MEGTVVIAVLLILLVDDLCYRSRKRDWMDFLFRMLVPEEESCPPDS
jgi:hypothetical protein